MVSLYTILLALAFTSLQIYEYKHATFDISDGIYGSTFYMATGFHGFHVTYRDCFYFSLFCTLYTFTTQHHVGFEAAAWYWHFVDVGLVVFICFYLLVGVVYKF